MQDTYMDIEKNPANINSSLNIRKKSHAEFLSQ